MRCSAGLCRRGSSVIWMLVLRGFGGINLALLKLGTGGLKGGGGGSLEDEIGH